MKLSQLTWSSTPTHKTMTLLNQDPAPQKNQEEAYVQLLLIINKMEKKEPHVLLKFLGVGGHRITLSRGRRRKLRRLKTRFENFQKTTSSNSSNKIDKLLK